ncbi:PEP-CTERM sorting domain-containing protein [Uliginosibacterium flavum]|uniref:PEP-CTERM sorting domain-containing protein n=1 Tax=Uliginosibacterium flavum TaxID=1396831 RepID=A0ABV2TSU7_9RHOO
MLLVLAGMQSAQALNAGDIAFTAFNGDAENFAFVSWVDIASGTTISFTDNEWLSASNTLSTTEGTLIWTALNSISVGTVVSITTDSKGQKQASSGSVSTDTKFDLNVTAESLYAFQGSAAAPSFLTGLTTYLAPTPPATLTPGVNLLALPTSTDFSEYTGARSGKSLVELRSAVNNSTNWTGNIGGDGATVHPLATVFAPVPEAGSAAMLLSGLSLLGFMVKRRKTLA